MEKGNHLYTILLAFLFCIHDAMQVDYDEVRRKGLGTSSECHWPFLRHFNEFNLATPVLGWYVLLPV